MTATIINPNQEHKRLDEHYSEDKLTVERIKSKQFRLGVIGLGYVGLPLSLVFAHEGVRVTGFDVDKKKVESISKGENYLDHLEKEGFKDLVQKGFLQATDDFSYIKQCDVVIICVPTPLTKHLEPDLEYIVKTCEAIAPHLKPQTLISLESTTWPGTTEEVVKPIIERNSSLRVGKDLFLCFSPEREDPGNPIYNTKNIPKVIGGIGEESLNLGDAVYSLGMSSVVRVKTTKEAEASKLLENIFRSVNIALVNELKMIFDKMDIDVWEVIKAASTKPFGYMPFWPGPGLGGHCIPIDPFYLAWKAKEEGISTRFIELAGEINRFMPSWVVGKVQDCLNDSQKPVNGSKILILGLAYKADIGDMRESPSLEIMQLLEDKGAKVDYFDPYISIIPDSRDYSQLKDKKSCQYTSDYDCFILATDHKDFDNEDILSKKVPIIDTRNAFPNVEGVYKA
ncbi:UDP-N-acetyl-D-glucosamine 6-dehydrogenase [Chlamydiales bacterium SCGC AB-751-O23]|nr:UDP-N-acetyl-D-glucosamine 6-dehydrogenase [Chlamydiales bacterium SCGC AB-751-O23]